MIIACVNDDLESITAVGRFLHGVGANVAYLSISTRPTPYPTIGAPDEEAVNQAYQVLTEYVPDVEYLIGYEGDEFASSGDIRDDLLGITAVHPMRASAVKEFLTRAGENWKIVDDLIAEGDLTAVTYSGERYYVTRFGRSVSVRHKCQPGDMKVNESPVRTLCAGFFMAPSKTIDNIETATRLPAGGRRMVQIRDDEELRSDVTEQLAWDSLRRRSPRRWLSGNCEPCAGIDVVFDDLYIGNPLFGDDR